MYQTNFLLTEDIDKTCRKVNVLQVTYRTYSQIDRTLSLKQINWVFGFDSQIGRTKIWGV